MNPLYLRYLLQSIAVTALAALAMQWFIGTILVPELQGGLTGAAFVAGWWGNLAAAIWVGISGARKAVAELTDPRMGRVVGSAIGLWIGMGALLGNAGAAGILTYTNSARVNPGLVLILGLISMLVAIVAAGISGRENAQPPAEEEA
jgi:hypothetical protein